MAEKNFLWSLTGNDDPPTTIVPLYRSSHGAKILSMKAEIWTPTFDSVPFPAIDVEWTQDEQNATFLKNEFDNAQIILYLFIRNLNAWHLVRFFPLVSRGAPQSPDILLPFKNSFGYFSLQKSYALGVFLAFPQRYLGEFDRITILGDLEESILAENEVIDDSPIPVPEVPPIPGGVQPIPESTLPVSLVVEAETGEMYNSLEVVSDPLASSGSFVRSPEGGSQDGVLRLGFMVPVLQDYAIWVRVKSPHSNANSFEVRVHDGSYFEWIFEISSNWTWQRMQTLDGINKFSLDSGYRVLEFSVREGGAEIDRVWVTSDLGETVTPPDSI